MNRAYVTKPLVASVVGDLGPILIIVMSATGLLLLLACVNVTNLLLARGAARGREMAVRVAIGAPRGRIVRQLLTESVLLSGAGAVLGLLLAYVGVRGLLTLGASNCLASTPSPSTGASPLRTRRARGQRTSRGFRAGAASGGHRCAGADDESTRSRRAAGHGALAERDDRGRDRAGDRPRRRCRLAGAGLRQSPDHRSRIRRRTAVVLRRVFSGSEVSESRSGRRRFPRVDRASGGPAGGDRRGATSNFPLRNSLESSLIAQFHGIPVDPAHPIGTRQRIVSPGYFQSTGTRLLQGRDFGPDDRANTRPVAIINKAFVKRYLNGGDPLGLQFAAGYPKPDPRNEVTVIGVVDDVRQKTVSDAAEPAFYSPLSQLPLRRQTVVLATSAADVGPLETAVRDEVRRFDPQIAVEFERVTDLVSGTLRRQQLGMTLMLIFGAVAILLAAVGIYGVVAYAVSQRRGEMATRLALGATPGSVFGLVMKQGALLAMAGTAIGLVVAYLSGQIVASRIYAIRASDPIMLGAAIALVAAITGAATMIPAWRASRLKPSGVLHSE